MVEENGTWVRTVASAAQRILGSSRPITALETLPFELEEESHGGTW
jgi:hypothetical protein